MPRNRIIIQKEGTYADEAWNGRVRNEVYNTDTLAWQPQSITSAGGDATEVTLLLIKSLLSPSSRTDTYTGAASGTAVDASLYPKKNFAIQVTKSGAVTAWNVILEGSLDGTTYETITTHTEADGDGKTKWPSVPSAAMYFRSRCVSMTGGTNIAVKILGMP